MTVLKIVVMLRGKAPEPVPLFERKWAVCDRPAELNTPGLVSLASTLFKLGRSLGCEEPLSFATLEDRATPDVTKKTRKGRLSKRSAMAKSGPETNPNSSFAIKVQVFSVENLSLLILHDDQEDVAEFSTKVLYEFDAMFKEKIDAMRDRVDFAEDETASFAAFTEVLDNLQP